MSWATTEQRRRAYHQALAKVAGDVPEASIPEVAARRIGPRSVLIVAVIAVVWAVRRLSCG